MALRGSIKPHDPLIYSPNKSHPRHGVFKHLEVDPFTFYVVIRFRASITAGG